jgi:hypothetical protein
MTDIDCNSEMKSFHNVKVTLSKSQQDEMRSRRDNGRTRLENGLKLDGHPTFYEMASQGSYQMRTMVQDDDNEYDIDDGVYFTKDSLIDNKRELTPFEARTRVCEALKWDGRLKMDAEVKNNCVRQDYPAGYHIDIPVYRIMQDEDENGVIYNYFELASGYEWVKSDARAVTKWFNNIVGELNTGATDGSQLRRIVKLTKKLARSRDAWKSKTTSGISITKLVVDYFYSADNRDDQALRNTWKNIKAALDTSTIIEHPVLDGIMLAQEWDDEVQFFRDTLADALQELEILDSESCTRKKARSAWDTVFNTAYFSNQPDTQTDVKEAASLIITSSETSRRNDGGGRFG